MGAFATVVILLAGLGLTRAALFIDPADIPSTDRKYEYIIVGAGPGGSVVLSRLSEDLDANVLLIEAGPKCVIGCFLSISYLPILWIHSDEGVLAIQVPYLGYTLQPNTTYYWNYTTTPQTGLVDGRAIVYSRGCVLGGSSQSATQTSWFGRGAHGTTSTDTLRSVGTTAGPGTLSSSTSERPGTFCRWEVPHAYESIAERTPCSARRSPQYEWSKSTSRYMDIAARSI